MSLAFRVTLLMLVPGIAAAQYAVPSQTTSSKRLELAVDDSSRGPTRSRLWEVGSSLNFITSEPSLADQELKFTDLVLLRVHGLMHLSADSEIFVGVDLLPKQPSYTDELEWQGALLGARHRINERWAGWARASGGPMIAKQGWWLAGDTAVQYRLKLEKVLFFESSFGASHTQLLFDASTEKAFSVSELFAQTGIALRERSGKFSAWLWFDYYLPVWGRPNSDFPDRPTGLGLEPQPRVNFHMGSLLGVSKTVDLFVQWSILDRGDVEAQETTLPILNRGFDQNQLLFGFMRRFRGRPQYR